MMLHTGYLSGSVPVKNYKAEGMPTGIGGAIHFHIGKHFRIGTEGFSSNLNIMDNGSYIQAGWGGITANWRWQFGRWYAFFGATAGGGSVRSLLMFEGNTSDWIPESDITLHKEAFMLIDPYIGIEYALTDKVHLIAKLNRVTPLKEIDMPLGVRLFFGFMFTH